MELAYTFILIIHIVVCIFLILIVLLQSGKGAELGAAFGSVGQANTVRTSSTFIGKFTTGMAVIFMITSLSLAYMSSDKASSSVTNTITVDQQPIPQTKAPVPKETKTNATEESTSPKANKHPNQ